MSTVAQVIDRLKREYLYPASDQPSRATLNGALTAVATTVPFTVGNLLTPEELDLLGEGVVIEIGQEWMLVTAWSSPNATVIRGWEDTTAATHADGDVIYIAPQFSRKQIFDAVCDAVVDLYPDLYAVRTREYTAGTDPIDIDSYAVEAQRFLYDSGAGHWNEAEVELLLNYPGAGSQVALQFNNVPAGTKGWLTYYSKFPRPTAESDDLASSKGAWAIPEEWVKIIMVDALAGLVASRQIDNINTDFIVDLLTRQGFDPSDARALVVNLLQLRGAWVARAQTRLRQSTPIRVEMRR